MSYSTRNKEEYKLTLHCSDGVSIDAKPFAKESSAISDCYKYKGPDYIKLLDTNSDILFKVRDFCEKRANIQNDNEDPSANDVQEKLDAFNSEFRQHYHTHAIHLMIVAIRLEMKSLVDLLMEDVVDILTSMTSEDIYKIFFVNLKDYNHIKFEVMVDLLHGCEWAFNQIN